MASGEAFSEFTESPPLFPPTYKFEIDSCNYNLRRKPAWTDRILFRYTKNAYSNVLLGLKQNNYCSHHNYTQSDHKPVFSSFNIKVFSTPSDLPNVTFNINNNRWRVDDDNTATYRYTHHTMVPSTWDWIGLYPSQFTSMEEDRISYVYASTKPAEGPDESEPWYQVVFTDQGLLTPGKYCLLYIHAQFEDILGMSEPFECGTLSAVLGVPNTTSTNTVELSLCKGHMFCYNDPQCVCISHSIS
ncbi:INPP5J [Cordylochernes scorpioides]|uniref:INPP5J n=1 Tax=Cordylochernes scorpioides TaxID=51811 RepID=A0ABY6K702_9ARAC|nr:INPP5J [Cordylochernes scorpioides]